MPKSTTRATRGTNKVRKAVQDVLATLPAQNHRSVINEALFLPGGSEYESVKDRRVGAWETFLTPASDIMQL